MSVICFIIFIMVSCLVCLIIDCMFMETFYEPFVKLKHGKLLFSASYALLIICETIIVWLSYKGVLIISVK